VLFSNDRVADFINQSFEPAWQSVRPVPIVHIDFGDGNVLTRTLHGNILTLVCTSDGFVVDALPGIYTESAYRSQLGLLRDWAQSIQAVPADKREGALIDTHRTLAQVLKASVTPNGQSFYITKSGIETPLKGTIRAATPGGAKPEKTVLTDKGDVANWRALEEDTQLNETSRRLQIHELLAKVGLVRPDKVTRPIYKDVLHADLEDPYLGLGEVLFASYPFAKEDAAH
jgi:hypothetical protein